MPVASPYHRSQIAIQVMKGSNGILMDQSRQTEQQELVESVAEFLTAQSLRAEQRHLCVHCGAVMQSLEATFWLYGADSGWDLRLPICVCELRSAPPVKPSKRSAV